MEQTNNNLPELPTDISEVEKARADIFLPDDDWMDVDISGSLLDLDDDLEMPEYTIELNGARMAPVTGVQTIAGQSGHGKTQLMTLLMSAYLGADLDGIRSIWDKSLPKVLYVDTEMEKGNTQLVVARVARICNTKLAELKPRLYVMRLRDEENHANIWRKILKAVFDLKPDVLFLDGMIDIIGDFNDNKEASTIIRKVMKMADHYLMPIWAVMHQNPGTTKMAGHQGSFLERKSTAVLSPQKICDNETMGVYHFEIKNGKQRGEDIKPLAFHMELFELPNGKKNAYPVIGKSSVVESQKEEEPDYAAWVKEVMPQDGLSTRDLRLKIEQKFKVGHTKADKLLWMLEEEKYVTRDENKRYHLGESIEIADMFGEAQQSAPQPPF